MVYLLHTLLRPRRPRGGRGAARSAAAATPTSRASSARSTSPATDWLVVLHVHDVHRPRRQVPARRARRVGLRSARRAPRASCSPRRRTTCSSARPACERIVKRTAELEEAGRRTATSRAPGRHRSADDPEVPEPLVHALARPVRRRDLARTPPTFFATGLKGRCQGRPATTSTTRSTAPTRMDVVEDGKLVDEDVPMRNAMNEVLRDEYVEDCQRGVDKWNRTIAEAGIRLRAEAAEPPLPPPARHLRRTTLRPAGQPHLARTSSRRSARTSGCRPRPTRPTCRA